MSGKRKYTLDESVFSDPLTDEAKYWIGFLMADGCVHLPSRGRNSSKVISLILQKQDQNQIIKLIKFFKTNKGFRENPAKEFDGYMSQPQIQFSVISNVLADDLARYGVTERKTLTAEALLGLDKSPDFWRGFVDGNGHIYLHKKKRKRTTYCPYLVISSASQKLLHQFQAFCRENFVGCSAKISYQNVATRVCKQLPIGGRYAIQALELFYANGPALDRKKKKADSIVSYKKLHPKWCGRRLKVI